MPAVNSAVGADHLEIGDLGPSYHAGCRIGAAIGHGLPDPDLGTARADVVFRVRIGRGDDGAETEDACAGKDDRSAVHGACSSSWAPSRLVRASILRACMMANGDPVCFVWMSSRPAVAQSSAYSTPVRSRPPGITSMCRSIIVISRCASQ